MANAVLTKDSNTAENLLLAHRRSSKKNLYKNRQLYFMIAPAFILILIFNYVPLFGWIIAFKNYMPGRNFLEGKWLGLKQFSIFFIESSDYINVFLNTIGINLISLFVNMSIAFIFAILLREIRHKWFSRIIQSVTFIPYFISWVIAYSIIYALFASQSGVLNQFFIQLGLINEGINLIGDKDYAWTLIILLNLWKYLGYNSVIFISAAAGIPQEQYEAAEIDGANRFQKVKYVTVPNLVPTLVVLLVLNTGWLLNSNFEQFFMFTNSTNQDNMEVFDMYIYKYGFQLMNYSYATAIGILRTIVSLVLIIFVNNVSKRVSGSSIF